LLNIDKKIINNEKGAFFAFGPWWFVIIVMILGFIFSMFNKNKNVRNNNVKQFNDYKPIQKSTKTFKNDNICPQCGETNSITAKFCNGCGNNLNENNGAYCPNCGEKNSINAKFCQGCGKELNI